MSWRLSLAPLTATLVISGLFRALTSTASRDATVMQQSTIPLAPAKSETATLLALRAALPPEDVRRQLYVMLPNPVPMEQDAAAAQLARIEKPAICYGFAVAQLVAVGCWPDTVRAGRITRREPDLSMFVYERMRENHGKQADSSTILLQGHGESMALSVDEFLEWKRQYTLKFVNSLPIDPTPEQRQSGIKVVYRFSGLQASDSGAVQEVEEGPHGP